MNLHAKWEFGSTSEIEGLFGNLRAFIWRMQPDKMPDTEGNSPFDFVRPQYSNLGFRK
jgi:hypothetical protein